MLEKAVAENINSTQEWFWSDYQPNGKEFLTMPCSKCLLHLLDLLLDLNPPLSHHVFMATSPVISVLTWQYVVPSSSLLHFPSLILGPYSSLSAIIFVLLHVLFLFFWSLIFFSSYVILQILFQMLVQFKLAKTIHSLLIRNNLWSQLLLSWNIISVIITKPAHQASSVASKATQQK